MAVRLLASGTMLDSPVLMLISIRRRVTSRAIRPGTTRGSTVNEIQDT